MIKGAQFNKDRTERYALWRIWNPDLPYLMFVGLNPSTADEKEDDNTIKSVIRIATSNGYGGVYMTNCFPFISTDPKKLITNNDNTHNDVWLQEIKKHCKDVVFAWGTFKVVKELKRDIQLKEMFPDAKCLAVLKNGEPKHPLYCKSDSKLLDYIKQANENNSN